ncbi:site-specific DNA-methyltransferase [Streptomyces sp. NPDC012389]|uniref:site-specific DNA-methyltransferase n=1 Tax=Streptomyces sp. NPDC012389 TaxID=3364830 RepID=UPI0036F0AA9C
MGTSGRLGLSWINKDRALVSTQEGGYEWVDRNDFRVAETRLLRDVTSVGEVHDSGERAQDNLLIVGDSVDALRALTGIPEFSDEYQGKVKLVYIDPPFNTGQAFAQYDDGLEHSVWLTMMRDRLLLIRDLLAPDGSVWVHLDDAEMAYCKVLMDEVFTRPNFVATVVWEKTTSGRNDARAFSTDQDYILVYSRNPDSFKPRKVAHTAAADKAYKNQDNDPRGPWREVDYKCPKTADERPNLYYPIIHPYTGEEIWPRRERVWAYGREEHERHIAEDLLFWGRTGNYSFPKLKKFLTDRSADGTPPRTLWPTSEVDQSRTAKTESKKIFDGGVPFSTPKPERFMHRVIHLATEPGDIVLDCFGGSGTTAAVAHKMGRRWVTVEREPGTVESFVRPRLTKVVYGEDPGGVTELVGWEKGGGFRHMEVAPSMYERAAGRVLLAPWVTGETFSEAACAQLDGFAMDPHPEPPFVGRKGRQLLAVIDGLATDKSVQSIIDQLDEDERVVIVAKSYLREAADLLKTLSPGSRIKKAPQDLLDMKGRVRR